MNKREYDKQLKWARELDSRNVDFVYSYECGVHFTYDIEKYCKLIKPKNYPFTNENFKLIFNLEKIKKDKVWKIPNRIKKLEISVTPNMLFELKHEVCSWGYDGFRALLQKLIKVN